MLHKDLASQKVKFSNNHLIIYMDLNGTIMAGDTANGKSLDSSLWQLLCENYSGKWRGAADEVMTFRQYIERYLCPGDSKLPQIKKDRQLWYSKFHPFLIENKHPLATEIERKFLELKRKLSNQVLFPSFINLINYLENIDCQYTLVFRTFGSDLPEVIHEFERLTALKCEGLVKFEKGKLIISNDVVLNTPEEIQAFFKKHKILGGKDDWSYWNKHGEKQDFGKPYFYNKNAIFFDDNSKDKEIIAIVPTNKINQTNLTKDDLMRSGNIVAVNTFKSLEDDNYFINHVNKIINKYEINDSFKSTQKLSRGFQSIIRYLVDRDFPFAGTLHHYFYGAIATNLSMALSAKEYKYVHDGLNTKVSQDESSYGMLDQLLGILQPFADMRKDAVDTFKSYKSNFYIKRDALQPIHGLGNVLSGALNILVSPLVFVGNTVRYAFSSGSGGAFLNNMALNCVRSFSWIMEGATSLLRGLTQIAFSPLTYLIKMPLRYLITCKKGSPKIEDNKGIQRLVHKGLKLVNNSNSKPCSIELDTLMKSIHYKYTKALSRNQHTTIIPDIENKSVSREVTTVDRYNLLFDKKFNVCLNEERKKHAREYLGLFSRKTYQAAEYKNDLSLQANDQIKLSTAT
jgi:hypothetical protein